MPVITTVLSPGSITSATAPEKFTQDLLNHCVEILTASPDKVQVQIVQAIAPLFGAQIYLEVQYRHQDFRTPAVMEQFMQAAEVSCVERFGAKPRIRCFPQQNNQLFARN